MSKSVEFMVGTVKLNISFNTTDELRTALEQVEEIKNILKQELPEASKEPVKTTHIRKDLEGIIDNHGGKLFMQKVPDTKAKRVCLALYALDADGASPKDISTLSHVQNPSNSVLHDPSYKKYFRKASKGKYILTDVGLSFVTNTILPELRGEKNNATP